MEANRWAAEMAAIQREGSDEYQCNYHRVAGCSNRCFHLCAADHPAACHVVESAAAADGERGSWWCVSGEPSNGRGDHGGGHRRGAWSWHGSAERAVDTRLA